MTACGDFDVAPPGTIDGLKARIAELEAALAGARDAALDEAAEAERDRLRDALIGLTLELESIFAAFTPDTIEAWGSSNFDDVQQQLSFAIHSLKGGEA